jgi:hypothetical protein
MSIFQDKLDGSQSGYPTDCRYSTWTQNTVAIKLVMFKQDLYGFQ